jgi:calcium-translocating P-type ATPase
MPPKKKTDGTGLTMAPGFRVREHEVAKCEPQAWHAWTLDAVADALETSADGLDSQDAAHRLSIQGPNRLPRQKRRPWLFRFFDQFRNVLIYILLASALAAGLLGHAVDAVVIFGVTLLNATIGVIQEGKAEEAMAAIGRMLATTARVRRDGQWIELPTEELVPGDLVRVEAGDRVPADLRVFSSIDLQVDQAALTGESMPVDKHAEAVASDTELAELSSMVHTGSIVTRGTAEAWVVVTGAATELGKISHLISEIQELDTPLLKTINRFGRALTVLALTLAATMLLIASGLHGQSLGEGVLAAIALIVAIIPEGLPAIITITLAVGVRKMGRRNAIIRRLPAVETLGSVSVICSDKTGTLTRNELAARRVGLNSESIPPERSPGDQALELARIGVLCNDAEPGQGGDPIERALLALAEQWGLDIQEIRASRPRSAALPFSPELRLMATRHDGLLAIKGAPETILSHCDRQWDPSGDAPLDSAHWKQQLDRMTGSGLRVLALASRQLDESRADRIDPEHDFVGLTLLGLVGFADPPRPEVAEAIAACRSAGIDLKMITGDHIATARSIAEELGIAGENAIALTGREMDALTDEELQHRSEHLRVVARAAPENKLRLVQSLQARGQIVAMTGDGANDAPALKRADIGVAMGIKGTEASRQTSDIVLADDNFATLKAGVEEGRGVYDNIRKALLYILPTNVAETLVILLAVLAGTTLPVTPIQVLWVNLVTTVTMELSLAFEPLERDVMRRPPRPPDQPLLGSFMMFRVLWVGLALTLAVFALHSHTLALTGNSELARTVALNTLVFGELFYLFNCRRWQAFSFSPRVLFSNLWAWCMTAAVVVLQLALTYWPPLQTVFGTAALSQHHWQWILAVCVVLSILVELEKFITRQLGLAWASPGMQLNTGS